MNFSLQELAHEIRQNPKLIIADDFEIAVLRRRDRTHTHENGEATETWENEDLWISLRLMHRKRPGRSSTTFRGSASLKALVDSAFEMANHASPDPWFRFPLWRRTSEFETSVPLVPIAQGDLANIASLYPELRWVPQSLTERYTDSEEDFFILRKSEKSTQSYRRRFNEAHFTVADKDGEQWFEQRESRLMENLARDRLALLAKLLAKTRERRGGQVFSGRESMPVLMAGALVARLLEFISPAFRADFVQQSRSYVGHLKGQMIFSPVISLLDDGTLPGKAGTRPVDFEGAASQRTVLVRNGELKDFLYDSYAAARENRLGTGNFIREAHQPFPAVGVTNFYFEPSSRSLVEIIGDVKQGVYIDSVDEWKRSHSDELVVRAIASGWRLHQGNLGEPVWDIPVALNLRECFQKVISMGNDLIFDGNFGSSSILFENIPLGYSR